MSGRATSPPPQGDVDDSGGLLATTILVTIISIVLVTLRFATRIWIVKRVGWDDWTILFACLGHPIGMALVVVQIEYGFGRPVYYLSDHEFLTFMKYSYGEWLQTFATLMFTKVSICLFLLRITVSKVFIRPLQASVAILIISNIIISILWIFQCRPHLDRAWNTNMPGKCFSKWQLEAIIMAQAIISFVSDYFLSIFPIIILRKVQISFRSKVGLCALMGLGVVTGSLGVARTVLNWQNVTSDPTYLVIPNWYIRTWEVLFGVVAACVPTLRPGYKWLVNELHTQYTRRKSSHRSTTGQTPLKPRSGASQWAASKPSAAPKDDAGLQGEKSDRMTWDSDSASETRSFGREGVMSTDLKLPLQRMDSDNPALRPVPPPKPVRQPPHAPSIPFDQPSARLSTPPSHDHPHIATMKQPQARLKHPHMYVHPRDTQRQEQYYRGHHDTHGQHHPQPVDQHNSDPSRDNEPPHYPRDNTGQPRTEDQAMHVTGDLSTDKQRGTPLRSKRKDEEALVGGGYGDEEMDYRI